MMQWDKTQLSIMTTVAVTSFMGTFLISAVNIALPAIEQSYGLDAVALTWVVTAFLLATAMFLLPVGRWGDLTGIRRLFKAGIIVFTVTSLLCAIAPEGRSFIAFRYMQGIGTAFTTTTGPAILISAFPPQQRGRVLGIAVSAVYTGLAFGPFAGGLLTQSMGWRSIFYLSVVLGALTTVVAYVFLGRDKVAARSMAKINYTGTMFYMLGLVALVYGASFIPSVWGWAAIAAGIVALAVFWKFESKSASPVLETTLYTKNRLFAYSNLAALINYSATFAIVFLLSLYLQKLQDLDPRGAGMVLVAQPIMMAVFSPLAGRMSDYMQPRYLSTLGMAMCMLGLAGFAFLSANTPIWLIVVILVWVGLGFAFFSSPNMNTIMSSVDRNRYGFASGSAATMRVIGQIVSMTIATLFFAVLFGRQPVEDVPGPVFLQAMQGGFITFALISIAGVYFSFSRGQIVR